MRQSYLAGVSASAITAILQAGDVEPEPEDGAAVDWRLYVFSNNGDGFLSITELYLYDIDDNDLAVTVGGTATDSNHWSGSETATELFDRNSSTQWSTLGPVGRWARFTFDSPVNVHHFSILFNHATTNRGPKHFALQFSLDGGTTWRTKFIVREQTSWVTGVTRDYDPVEYSGSASSWALYASDNELSTTITVSELFMAETVGGASLTTGGTPFDGNHSASNPERAFDGSTALAWSGEGGIEAFIGYTFAAPIHITEVRMQTGNDFTADRHPSVFDVMWSDDDILFMSAGHYETTPDWGSGESRAFLTDLEVPLGWTTEFEWDPTGADVSDNWADYTLRIVMASYLFPISGTQIRVTLSATDSAGLILDKVYIGERALEGDRYDFGNTPIQLMFGGDPDISLATGESITSDPIDWDFRRNRDIVLSAYCPSGASGSDDIPSTNGFLGWHTSYKSGDNASAVNASSYTNETERALVTKVEVFANEIWQRAAGFTPLNSSAAWGNTTMRLVIPASAITKSGSYVRVAIAGDNDFGCVVDKAYIGKKASGGSGYDFDAPPTQLFFAGLPGGTAIVDGTLVSDPLEYEVTGDDDLIISMYVPSAGSNVSLAALNTLSGWVTYYKSGDDAIGTTASGYSTASQDATAVVSLDVSDDLMIAPPTMSLFKSNAFATNDTSYLGIFSLSEEFDRYCVVAVRSKCAPGNEVTPTLTVDGYATTLLSSLSLPGGDGNISLFIVRFPWSASSALYSVSYASEQESCGVNMYEVISGAPLTVVDTDTVEATPWSGKAEMTVDVLANDLIIAVGFAYYISFNKTIYASGIVEEDNAAYEVSLTPNTTWIGVPDDQGAGNVESGGGSMITMAAFVLRQDL